MKRILLALIALPSVAGAAPRLELVVGNQALVAGGPHLPANLEAFLRRLEEVGGWPKGTFHGKAYTRPRQALTHVLENKSAFAILPAHQFVEGRKTLGFEVLGRTVGVEGSKPAYWGVVRNEPRSYTHLEDKPGLRLAFTETYDMQWLKVLLERGVAEPERHFQLVPVTTDKEAVAAVLARKADVALIYETEFNPLRPRIAAKTDLQWTHTSGAIPPPAMLATKWAPKAERKRMAAALDKLCKETGAPACARMAIMYAQSNRAESYNVIIEKYANY